MNKRLEKYTRTGVDESWRTRTGGGGRLEEKEIGLFSICGIPRRIDLRILMNTRLV